MKIAKKLSLFLFIGIAVSIPKITLSRSVKLITQSSKEL
jgi:hypothetical protein